VTNLAIELSHLTRTYGSRRGISDVNLNVAEGSLFGFLGPNGAGKTTAIRVLLGFLRPTTGTARALNVDCWHDSARLKADVGSIPGDLRLWPWLTGISALKLFASIRRREMIPQGKILADELELDLAVPVRKMSRGMRQKLGLILALAHQPRLLILDEPTTALDPLMQDRLRKILRKMATAGHTVFFSSHTLGEVEELCERIAIVKQGQIVADGTLDDLRANVGREVAIAWQSPADASWPVPSGLTLTSRTQSHWQGTHSGDPRDLLAFLASKPVQDVSITKVDLETLFRRFYE